MACRLEILNKGGKIEKKKEKEEEKEETIRKIRTNIVEIKSYRPVHIFPTFPCLQCSPKTKKSMNVIVSQKSKETANNYNS